ncbi:MAG: NAD(P)H-dependent oxidoreductase [Rickettsiales bacterium]|nr:NAD(P)H-dependent oxidoreductase [Rickettsiales bacterium]
MSKLIFLAGSARKDSLNKKLAKQAFEIAKSNGVEAEFIDLKDYPMPIYDGDFEVENGLPENAKKLKAKFAECKGFFIASPEYNSSFSPLFKNAIDWISRPSEKGETPLIAFRGKFAALSAASPGGFGGLRGLVPLRMLLGNIGVLVLPDQLAIPFADKVFDAEGKISDIKISKSLQSLVDSLISYTN